MSVSSMYYLTCSAVIIVTHSLVSAAVNAKICYLEPTLGVMGNEILVYFQLIVKPVSAMSYVSWAEAFNCVF